MISLTGHLTPFQGVRSDVAPDIPLQIEDLYQMSGVLGQKQIFVRLTDCASNTQTKRKVFLRVQKEDLLIVPNIALLTNR